MTLRKSTGSTKDSLISDLQDQSMFTGANPDSEGVASLQAATEPLQAHITQRQTEPTTVVPASTFGDQRKATFVGFASH